MVASVIVDVTNKNVNKPFDYLVPECYYDLIKVGSRVEVPFGSRKIMGYVIELKEKSDFLDLKSIEGLIDLYPLLDEELVYLAKRMEKRYYTSLVVCLNQMIPSALRVSYQKEIQIVSSENLPLELKEILKNKKRFILNKEFDIFLPIISKEIKEGNLILNTLIKKGLKEKEKVYYKYKTETKSKSKKAKELLKYLLEINNKVSKEVIVKDLGYSTAIIKKLLDEGALEEITETIYTKPKTIIYEDKNVTLTEEQRIALDKINYYENSIYLLYGVTGSGKTEVYLKAIEHVLKENKTAILLVPEISLTPQLTSRFEARFPNIVAVLHSRLTIRERFDEWRRIKEGKAKVVVGARSAIFAPLENLGIIIIDEEHENSYAQDNMPAYNAKDIAKIRADYHNIPIILGSATPSITDYYAALNDEYTLLKLENRATNLEIPKTTIVDMKLELRNGNKTVLSNELYNALKCCLEKKEQAILFLNRRGFSTSVMCRSCGEVIKCPNCDMPLTYHHFNNSLKCHYCGYLISSPSVCPKCGSDKIRYVGLGTEKIEEYLASVFKEAKIIRMDRDTVSNKDAYTNIFEDFSNHKADILIGTQMLAKGLDFKDVTLVGIINADMALFYPSYDANEVAFSLLEQVSGRAGRHKKGQVIMQTYMPNNDVIKYAANHDYLSFYQSEIIRRKRSFNPPFVNIKEITFKSEDRLKALALAKIFHTKLNKNSKITILGPTESLLFKVNNIYSYTIYIKYVSYSDIEDLYNIYEENKDPLVQIRIGDV